MKCLRSFRNGERFLYGGIEWIKISNNSSRGVFCVTANVIANKPFSECNSNLWKTSLIREYLNGDFLDGLIRGGADRDMFVPFDLDLTADDGSKCMSERNEIISLISDDLYRTKRDYMPKVNQSYWTLTPVSYDASMNGKIRCVDKNGVLTQSHVSAHSIGVVALVMLNPALRVMSADDVEAISEASSDMVAAIGRYPFYMWQDIINKVNSQLEEIIESGVNPFIGKKLG